MDQIHKCKKETVSKVEQKCVQNGTEGEKSTYVKIIKQMSRAVKALHPSKSIPWASAWQQHRLYQLRTSGCCGPSLEHDIAAKKPLKKWTRTLLTRLCNLDPIQPSFAKAVTKLSLTPLFTLGLSGSRWGREDQGGLQALVRCTAAGGWGQTPRGERQAAGKQSVSTHPAVGHTVLPGLAESQLVGGGGVRHVKCDWGPWAAAAAVDWLLLIAYF